jgi:hypothetical protein
MIVGIAGAQLTSAHRDLLRSKLSALGITTAEADDAISAAMENVTTSAMDARDAFDRLADSMRALKEAESNIGCDADEYLRAQDRKRKRERQFWSHGKRKGKRNIPHW